MLCCAVRCCAVLCCAPPPCPLAQGQGDREKEISDCKLIVQNIVYGTKTLLFSILYCTRHYHSAQQHEAARAAAMAAGQVYLRKYWHQHGVALPQTYACRLSTVSALPP
jgi:hypothetical protein